MKLSPNFSLEEFTKSITAIRKGIDNTPSEEVISNLSSLCNNLLESIREDLNKPIRITSGYRSPKLNKAIGGAKNSQHIKGEAADIEVPGMSTEELFQFIKNNYDYDQLIQEFDSWIHISYSTENRNQNLRAIKKNKKTIYLPVN